MTGPGPGARAGVGSAVAGELRQLLAAATGRPELAAITLDTPLFGDGVGLDSLTGTLLLRRVRQRFGVDVAAEDLNLDALATLGTLSMFICDRVVSDQIVSDRTVNGGA
jgi:acyl carrier protein